MDGSKWNISLFYFLQLDGSPVVEDIPAVMGQFHEDVVHLEQNFLLLRLSFDSVGHEIAHHQAVGLKLCLRGVILQIILLFGLGVARSFLFLIFFGDEQGLLLRTELDLIAGFVVVDRFCGIFPLEQIWHLKRERYLRLLRKKRTLLILKLLRDILSVIQELQPTSLPISTLSLPHAMIVRENRLIVIILDRGIQLLYVFL